MVRRFVLMKIFWSQGIVCPCPRAIYMYKIFKHLSGNRLSSQSQTFCEAKLGSGNESMYKINGQGHMAKMATMAINSKNL